MGEKGTPFWWRWLVRLRNAVRGEDGMSTAEYAMGTIAVVFGLIATGFTALTGQLRCIDAAVEAARLVARGDRDGAQRAVAQLAPSGAELTVTVRGEQVSTEVEAPLPGGIVPGRWLRGSAAAVVEPGQVPNG